MNKIYCLFEQSGTFKNVFKNLGYEAFDYDIENYFGQTDKIVDIFYEINQCYSGFGSIFNNMTDKDFILAFFPCIYFTGGVNAFYFSGKNRNWNNLSLHEKTKAIIERAKQREFYYETLLKLVYICSKKNIPLVIENPATEPGYLKNNFFEPTIYDVNRLIHGDDYKKPTYYWFFNYQPKRKDFIIKYNKKEEKFIRKETGITRSLISKDYAKNFIHSFILDNSLSIENNNLNTQIEMEFLNE